MNAVTLRAHFDGKRIVLDEPFGMFPSRAEPRSEGHSQSGGPPVRKRVRRGTWIYATRIARGLDEGSWMCKDMESWNLA